MINLKAWGRALQQMQKLSPDEWQALDPISKWLIACRAPVLFMTFTAAALGGLLAWRDAVFHWGPWLATAAGLMLAHATNNLLNDYTDSRRGIDKNNYYRNQYAVQVLEDGLMTLRQFWLYTGITGGSAVLLGAWLVSQQGGLTLELMLAGMFFALFYTWPLKYFGLGEPAVLLVWGPLMVGGSYYVLAGSWSWELTWVSIVFALGPTTVLFGKHTDKLAADADKGVNTLPVIIGESASRITVLAMICAQYLLCGYLVLSTDFGWPLLLVFANLGHLPRLIRTFLKPKPDFAPPYYPAGVWPLWFSAHSFNHTRRFTTLFLIGVIADTLLQSI
ncbi:prenyltransferase [Parahaliea sp. F7430]|uniref:Prenyltransferase n=1 Tax=Sediminihaliea albiluteola TaxID=2758564 RepID=A0A7W2TTI7_9GAMM|nr:prenyltransferase [Sediminihaliea albiluteola]MBA6411699.1 prenyltransferase [Sediminihaliea albiluteola]